MNWELIGSGAQTRPLAAAIDQHFRVEDPARLIAKYARKRRVIVGDDDASGRMYFPMLFHYMSEGEQELLMEIGQPVWEQVQRGEGGPVVHASCDYHSAVFAGSELNHQIELFAGRRSSFMMRHTFRHKEQAIASGRIIRSWIASGETRPSKLPDWLRRDRSSE